MSQAYTAGDLAICLRGLRERAERQQRSLKISKLARAIGMSQQSVYAYLDGTTLPPARIFDDLLQALGATPDEIVQLWQLRTAIEESRRRGRDKPARPAEENDGWPKLVGLLPARADCHVDRTGGLAALRSGPATIVLAGVGGVGKSQMAAHHAREALRSGAVDFVLWLVASSRDAVISAYAHAAEELRLAASDPERAAARLHAWFETTTRRWLVVLDDVADADALRGLWPAAGRGWVIVTTRRRDSAIRSGGRQHVEVLPFSEDEAVGYLRKKLAGRGDPDESLAALSADLGHLPLALAQACAYIVDRGLTCDEYRRRFAEHRNRVGDVMPETGALPDDHAGPVDTIWSLSISRADELSPAGLAGPALAMGSVLHGPAIPVDIWTTPAGLAYLARTGRAREPVTPQQAHESLRNLARLSLIDLDGTASTMAVHTLVQAGVRAGIGSAVLADVVRCTADALAQLWPDRRDAGRGQVLRANADALRLVDEEALWHPVPHDIIFKTGNSLGDLGHVDAATRHFDSVVARARELHGADHPGTLTARTHRAVWLGKRGDAAGARDELADLLEQATGLLDSHDPIMAEIRGNHAYFVGQAGDYARAIELTRELLRDWPAGALDDASVVALESNIAFFAGHLGHHEQAAAAYRQVFERARAVLGPDHLDTLKAWANAIGWRGEAGDKRNALDEFRALLPEVERALGSEHTLAIRTRYHVGRLGHELGEPDASERIGEALAASERLLGWAHPHTIDIRIECALLSRDRGDLADAVDQLQDVLVDARAVLGDAHPRTSAIQKLLADLS